MSDSEECQVYPTKEEIEVMARDLHLHAPTNVSEAWCRILYRLANAADPEWRQRLFWAVNELRRLSVFGIDREALEREVSIQEGHRMGWSNHRMPLFSTLLLHALVTAVEQEIGTDHVDMQPVRWFRRGLRERAARIATGGGDEHSHE